jgi:ubiquinone/menaquinone biosynthesis C-methylase UbiE
MKLNFAERMLVNNGARALVQRFYEGPLLRRMGGPVEGARVLDVGCGRGVGVELLLRQFGAGHVCGVDLDGGQIRRAERRLNGVHEGQWSLTQASVEHLPFDDASFDAVFDFGMLHHVPRWQAGVAEIRRVLKPGGRLFFEEVTRAALERWSYRTFLEHPKENRFSESEFVEELRRQGLTQMGATEHVLFGDIFIGVAKLEEEREN